MSIKSILKQLPTYAGDIIKNIKEIFMQESKYLANYQKLGIALTVGYALKNESLLNHIREEAKKHLDNNEAQACKIAVVNMSMTNTYYNFSKKVDNDEIKNMDSLLSLEHLYDHNIDEKDFFMYCLSVSMINSCEFCINFYIKKLIEKDCTPEVIHYIGKIVSVIKAAGDVLEIESMRSYEFMIREESF
ncbi:MAG: alkyl hydroperoxide reductase subunit D [Candidatus Midichloriaceae bacterium]|jgi:alkyl hydroperoxide reductase subunit D